MKILYVTTIAPTINAFLAPHILMLRREGHQVDIACNLVGPVDSELVQAGCVVHDLPFQRSVLSRANLRAYRQLKKLVGGQAYDLVHTHTPIASACVRLACRTLPQTRVIYTAHGFHFSTGSPLRSWLLYYPLERWLARHTDVLITINREDHGRALKSFAAGQIEYLPGVGLDLEAFPDSDPDRSQTRRELGIPEGAILLLSVGEVNANKNHQAAVRALAALNDSSVCYAICGSGPMEEELRQLAESAGIGSQVTLLGFRDDVRKIYHAADLFVFPSRREGLPVSLMEAMAAGLPVVCTAIRGNSDLIVDGRGGLCVAADDVSGLTTAIGRMIVSPETRRAAGEFNRTAVQAFDLSVVLPEILRITNSA